MAQIAGGLFIDRTVTQSLRDNPPSKIIEGFNLHWLRTLGNSDNKDLVPTSFHS